MSQVFVGTAYHQVYCVPLDPKSPITQLGEKKKSPVTSIHLPTPDSLPLGSVFSMQQLRETLHYTDAAQSFEIRRVEENGFGLVEMLPAAMEGKEKILQYEIFNGKRIYYTNLGNVYYPGYDESLSKEEAENSDIIWSKLFYNDMYAETIKSLPPQRAGKQLPEYTRVSVYNRDRNIQVGFVGRGVVPFVYQANESLSSITWKGKNVKNDELDLEVPQNDIDLCFLNLGCHLVAANAQNMIRIYDVKGRRRRPMTDVTLTEITKVDKVQLSKMAKSSCEKYLYVGNHKGSIYELDVRKNLGVSGKFKGITTTIKDMQVHGESLAVVSLDGYLRIFNTSTKEKQFQRYLNTQPEVLKLSDVGIIYPEQQAYNVQQIDLQNDNEEPQKKVEKVKKIRKRNKVGLKYLQPREFDDVKIEAKNEGEPEIKAEGAKNQYEDEDLDL